MMDKEHDSTDGKNDVAMKESLEENHSENKDKKGSEDNEKLCPLFMDGLPSDFSTNPGLAAIASLFDEESDDTAPKKKEYEAPSTTVGGGKLRRTPARSERRNDGRPYQNRQRESETKAASVGETHLFLKMWKL